MTIKECYDVFGGDYNAVLSRLMTEGLVKKFLLKFPQDGSYDLLIKSLDEGNYEEAFRAAHTIKGICHNLGIESLLASVSPLTEELRDGKGNFSSELLDKVKEDYRAAVSAVNTIDV